MGCKDCGRRQGSLAQKNSGSGQSGLPRQPCLLPDNDSLSRFEDVLHAIRIYLNRPTSLCYFCSQPRQHLPVAQQPRRQVLWRPAVLFDDALR